MFISKIVICNVFAYYGEVSVEFEKQEGKNLYCIYGDNGFGKTSFIRCAKLLFLGTDGVDTQTNPVISRFAPKIKSPQQFIKGNKEWNGILNKDAFSQGQKLFFVCFEGLFRGQEFILKRFWERDETDKIKERLNLRLGADEFKDEQAQEKVNLMLPQNFVEFFFFDGEEIEKISDNLRTKLREKIEDMLQISPLDSIIKQSKKLQDELKQKEVRDKGQALYLVTKKREEETLEMQIRAQQESLNERKNRQEECQAELKGLESELLKLISDTSKEQERLVSQKQNAQEKLFETKKELTSSLKAVMLAGSVKLVDKLKNELDTLENSAQKGDIESLKRLMPQMIQIASQKLQDTSQEVVFNELLNEMPLILEQSIAMKMSQIPLNAIKELYGILNKNENSPLSAHLRKIKQLNKELTMLEDELNSQNTDDYTKMKQDDLNKQKSECEEKKAGLEKEINECNIILSKFVEDKEKVAKDIYNTEQSISTERIEGKLGILETLRGCMQKYKERLVGRLREELHDKILEKYKLILPNDNINELEIGEDFEIKLKDKNGETIVVESQSSGQKQILAICIFWALSELSNSQIPLIIDTPLSRIDATNRANIIQHYYTKGTQVIILPHSGEIGEKEFELAKPHLAGLYKITNTDDRQHAKIKQAGISEIL